MDEVYSGESYLELREDGRGTLCLGGDEAEFRWQLDGTALTLTSGRETCRGTLENGRIETDLFGADIRLSFRQSAAPAQEPRAAGRSRTGRGRIARAGCDQLARRLVRLVRDRRRGQRL